MGYAKRASPVLDFDGALLPPLRAALIGRAGSKQGDDILGWLRAPSRDLAAAQCGERGIDDLEAVEGTTHVSSQNGAHRLLSAERGVSRLAQFGRFGHVALRVNKAAACRGVGTLQVAALDAFGTCQAG